jgi:putative chitinase
MLIMKLQHLLGINDTLAVDRLPQEASKELQLALTSLGYSVGDIDGIVGAKTRYAWKRFKEDNHQDRVGEIGSGSIAILQSKLLKSPVAQEAIDWRNEKQKISEYFTVGEVTKGDPRRIPSDPKVIKNILSLARELDKVREAWGSPIRVTSWYRPPAVNASVGGARSSQHLTGSAADIAPHDGSIQQFQSWLDKRWDKALGYGAKKGFVHVDLRPGRLRWNY